MLAFCLKVLRSPQVKAPERIWERNSWMHQTTHHSFGWVARLILTVVTPTLKSASALNAAFVRSTCLEPWAQPAHVSITRTNIHLFLLLHTVKHKNTSRLETSSIPRTFEKLETFWSVNPSFQSEGAGKWFVLDKVNQSILSLKTAMMLTVGAQLLLDQQLGLRRSWPVYLWLLINKVFIVQVAKDYHVIMTSWGFPMPLKPFQTPSRAPSIAPVTPEWWMWDASCVSLVGLCRCLYWKSVSFTDCQSNRGSKL